MEQQAYQVQLPVFKGPLDLLLHLIEQQELDITTIALAQVTDQYLAYLQYLHEASPDDLTAFLTVAARLLLLKSRALLPRPPQAMEETEDVGEDLVRQLREYRQFKQIAHYLRERDQDTMHMYPRDLPVSKLVAGWQPKLDLSGTTLEDLPPASVIGTSSLRRQAQLLHYRPDLRVESIRGNVDTRLRKVTEGQYDAILLAAAGVTRLGLEAHITQYLPLEVMAPAPGQGGLAIQCRSDDEDTRKRLNAINHTTTQQAVSAERAFLAGLGGGCSLPVGAYAVVEGGAISLRAVAAAPDGSRLMRFAATGQNPLELGTQLAKQALAEGAGELLA